MVLFCIIYYYWKAPNRKLLKQELRNMLAIVRVKSASKISHCFSLIKSFVKCIVVWKRIEDFDTFGPWTNTKKIKNRFFINALENGLILLMDVDRQFSVYGQDKGKAKVFEDADRIASQAEPNLVDLYLPLTFLLF